MNLRQTSLYLNKPGISYKTVWTEPKLCAIKVTHHERHLINWRIMLGVSVAGVVLKLNAASHVVGHVRFFDVPGDSFSGQCCDKPAGGLVVGWLHGFWCDHGPDYSGCDNTTSCFKPCLGALIE